MLNDQTASVRKKNSTVRVGFVTRLKLAVTAAGCAPTPTQIARHFNLRFPDATVSVQAVRKWLKGEAYPADAKLIALGEWLAVDAAWLRYGDTSNHPAPVVLDEQRDALARDLTLLTPAERAVIRNMTDLILGFRSRKT